MIPVYDPAADAYRWITFEDLLAGVALQGVVQIDGAAHDVWAQTGASYAVGTEYVFFAADAVAP